MPALDLYAELQAIVAALEGRGLRYALCGAVALAAHGRPRATGHDLVMVDLLVASGPLSAAWEGRVRLPWEDRSICVVSREGLVEMKRLANRPQDRADLVALGEDDDGDA